MNWYESSVASLEHFEPWERDETLPLPNVVAKRNAAAVLCELAKLHMPEPRVGKLSEGGVCISYREGILYMDVDCHNNGEMLTGVCLERRPPIINEVEPTLDCHAKVARMMRNELLTPYPHPTEAPE